MANGYLLLHEYGDYAIAIHFSRDRGLRDSMP